jgi:putative membrane protein
MAKNPAPQECQTMFVRLSAAIAAVSLLSSAALAQGAKPTDPQIAHIAYTAGVIDIAAAKQALTKTSTKDVKAFAEDMVRDHEAVNKQALDLVKKLKVTPEDNDTSRTLSKNAAEKLAELGKLKGAEFDKAYVANEVAYHKAVDSALETSLIPNANNAELKSLLQTGLKIFQGHEQHADRDRADVGSVRLGACGDHSNHDGESRDLASGGVCESRRHHRMDQQGYFRPYRDGAKWRLGRHDAAEKDRHPGFEEGRYDRLLLPLPSEHEGYPRSRAMRPLERSEMGQKRSLARSCAMFALPRRTDISEREHQLRKVPGAVTLARCQPELFR